MFFFFFFQAEDGIRDKLVTGVQTCALPISGKRPWPNKWLRRLTTPPRSTRKQQSPRSSSDIGEPFQKRKPVNYHPIENMTIGSNYDRMPPMLSIAKSTPCQGMNRRSSMSTSRIISTKAILWHHRPDTDPPRSRSKRRTAPSELYMTTGSSTSIRSSTLHRCPKYRQSLKNSEESRCLASSISGQDTTTFVSQRRTHTKPDLKQTKNYSNGSSCNSDYAA